ncbi:hypothetical protein AKJ52_02660 [candidate division MSBL1 archaeon SCGC-AAA382C18]|uniref:Uncharacterized protein n=1 Tax=candidate division MSBL1 archaeon SCGC-AAA382C18 TaxID=1698281 RepID=A0A133VHW1_9EURY|nr:hypothetical protein AKJ52_02660 [candidate division MSBL1 archaeon SCGC-AAA382C18]
MVNSCKTNIGEDRLVTLEATGKDGWGKWRIVKNESVNNNNIRKVENVRINDSENARGENAAVRELQKHKHRRRKHGN